MKIGNPSFIAHDYMEKGMSDSCPIIDMHGHLGPFTGGYLPSAPIDRMRKTLARAGVRKIVCSAHESIFGDVNKGNTLMQATINRYPETFLGYWGVNPNNQESVIRAGKDWEKSNRFVGFKLLPDYHTYPINGNNYIPVLEYANEHRLIVLIHTWGGSPFDSPQLVAQVAKKYPEAIFLMGHSGYGDWENAVGSAASISNLYLELCAVYVAHDFSILPAGSGTPLPLFSCPQVNGIIEFMVEKASSKKIVFGTDMPWYSPYYAAGAVLFARINDEQRHDILHRNAERLLADFI